MSGTHLSFLPKHVLSVYVNQFYLSAFTNERLSGRSYTQINLFDGTVINHKSYNLAPNSSKKVAT